MLCFKKGENQAVHVTVLGSVEESQRKALSKELADVIDEGYVHFELDLSNVEYIDSTGIAVFVELRKKLIKRNGSIYLYNLPKQVERLFRTTQLDKLLCQPPNRSDGGACHA